MSASGAYQAHRVIQPSFTCLACGAPALDLSLVPTAMAALEEEDDPTPTLVDILCPLCETAVTVGPDSECPNCGSPLDS